MKNQKAVTLIKRYVNGECSQEEIAFVETWYIKESNKESGNLADLDYDAIELEILNRIRKTQYPQKVKKLWTRSFMAVAALILVVLSFGVYFYVHKSSSDTNAIAEKKSNILPGSDKATLTLADGRRISLTDAKNGDLEKLAGFKITKKSTGALVYSVSNSASSNATEIQYNIIETPRGGQYQVILPDGTKVWLNAASSLKFPTSFASVKERKVILKGEAYFEVAKDKTHAFIVETDNQNITVLGTHFNVYSYAEDNYTKTTLLEGSVIIERTSAVFGSKNTSIKLIPGQQSFLINNDISITEVNTEEAIAWKNGYFRFDDEKLESVMRKISRWYDVDVIWKDETLKNESFGALTSRFTNVSKLLEMMEKTGVAKFRISKNQIIISKKR